LIIDIAIDTISVSIGPNSIALDLIVDLTQLGIKQTTPSAY
jgi:hypothetical protein